MQGWRAYGLAILAGLALALGHAPVDFPWLIFLAVPGLFHLMRQTGSFWRGFLVGLFAGIGYFGLTLNWIVEPFLVDPERHGWMAPFALVFLSAGLALFWAVPFGLAARLERRHGLPFVLLFAALWSASEYGRSILLTGFPWALLPYVWGETPIIQLLAFIGPHNLGLLTLLLCLGPFTAPPRHMAGAAIALFAFGTLWFTLSQRPPETTTVLDTNIRLVQPNAQQSEKWQPENLQKFFDRQLTATSAAGDVDLIVWPEVAVPYLIDERLDLNAAIANAAGKTTPVVVGGRRIEQTDAGERWYNSAAVISTDGSLDAVYDKQHLVPFGEYLPVPALFDRYGLKAIAQNAGRFAAGTSTEPIRIEGLPDVRLLICYEAIFPHEIVTGDARPGLLLHLTNDAWFGTFSGPYQHLAQARFRAIEQGLPLARSANTGVSAMIDPYGRITHSLELNSDGHIDAAIPKALPPTLYAQTGDKPFHGVIVLLLAWTVVSRRRLANAEIPQP